MTRPLTIVVTGTECTGKTTLAAWLAATLGAPLSAEYARKYVDQKRAPLTAADVEPIARGQMAGEDAALRSAVSVVVKDTDLLSTVVYARHYYGCCPAWIEQAAANRLGDLYLLLHPDVPWVADGLQRDRPAQRDLLHGLFRATLAVNGARVVDIQGEWAARYARAEGAIRGILPGS
ncbi:MAG: AAA family ATPase [Acidobacteriota bacterium]